MSHKIDFVFYSSHARNVIVVNNCGIPYVFWTWNTFRFLFFAFFFLAKPIKNERRVSVKIVMVAYVKSGQMKRKAKRIFVYWWFYAVCVQKKKWKKERKCVLCALGFSQFDNFPPHFVCLSFFFSYFFSKWTFPTWFSFFLTHSWFVSMNSIGKHLFILKNIFSYPCSLKQPFKFNRAYFHIGYLRLFILVFERIT